MALFVYRWLVSASTEALYTVKLSEPNLAAVFNSSSLRDDLSSESSPSSLLCMTAKRAGCGHSLTCVNSFAWQCYLCASSTKLASSELSD